MVFNSSIFFVFFALVYLAYLRVGHRAQNRLLLAASYFFYGYWDYRFLSLIFISTLVDYLVAHRIAAAASPRGRRAWLWLSLGANLGMLGFFKYCDFFVGSLTTALDSVGLAVHPMTLGIVVPVGISFYTFQTMGYTIDVYRGKIKPCDNLPDFALYVAFFPQLVAGPIERSENLLPQIRNRRILTPEGIQQGAWWIVLGLFLKVVVADNLAPIADDVFAAENPGGGLVWAGVLAFCFQIYGDFAGYSLMARGFAKLMGIDLMRNFNAPYVSATPSEFWSRWHISLSGWLRDYLYIPLGGNRHGRLLTVRNLMLTMLLGGLWHGAAWRFVLWGAFHGGLLVLYRAGSELAAWLRGPEVDERAPRPATGLTRVVQTAVFFFLTLVGWIIFRCENLAQIYWFPWRMLTDVHFTLIQLEQFQIVLTLIAPVALFELLTLWHGNEDFVLRAPRPLRWPAWATVVALMYVFGSRGAAEFIYFQF